MDSRTFKSFSITIRPKDGITDEQIQKYCAFSKKKSLYCYIVTEKEASERHVHAALITDKATRVDNLQRSIINLYPDFTNAEKRVAILVKPMYNFTWITYLQKGDSTVIVESNLPEVALLDSYFPEEPKNKVRSTVKSTYYGRLEKLWFENTTPDVDPIPVNCRNFLFDMMYNKRVIDPLRDDKTIIQVSRHLSRYIKKTNISCVFPSEFELDE